MLYFRVALAWLFGAIYREPGLFTTTLIGWGILAVMGIHIFVDYEGVYSAAGVFLAGFSLTVGAAIASACNVLIRRSDCVAVVKETLESSTAEDLPQTPLG